MPKIITPLTAAQVKNAKPKDRLYKLADGGGLALWVKPNGSKVWRFSFNGENGKPQTLTLGAYPLFSLVQAREWRDEQKRKLALGQNIKRVKVRTAYTLEKIAREWHAQFRAVYFPRYWKPRYKTNQDDRCCRMLAHYGAAWHCRQLAEN